MTDADFAAAQRRVAARQHKRLEASHAIRAPESISSSQFSRLPPGLREFVGIATTFWPAISGREGTNPAFRVGQVDAELLDEELLTLMTGQVGEGLKYLGPYLVDDWRAEILLVLRGTLFKLSLWDHDASYGAALQNLKYSDARNKGTPGATPQRWQKALYGIISVGGRYVWTKWEDYLLDAEGGYDEPSLAMRRMAKLSGLLSSTHSVAAFASFLVFLVNGRYRTLLDRILRLRLLPATSQVSREVSFEYLNRQLVWHAFTEFLLFILPLVGISRWRRWLGRAWRKAATFLKPEGNHDDEDLPPRGELGFLPERTCAICYQDQNLTSTSREEIAAIAGATNGVIGSAQTDITNPYETVSCGCIYCYVCIAQRLEGEDGEGWVCLRCGEIVHECKPWNGDILETKSGPSSRKSVSFADEQNSSRDIERVVPGPVDGNIDIGARSKLEVDRDDENQITQSMEESAEWSKVSALSEDDEGTFVSKTTD